jgi:SNF2 family DNA or RNA helicase
VNRLKKRYVLFLTATPVHNNLRELYNLITVLKPGLLGTYHQFRRQFIEAGGDRRVAKNRTRLKTLLRDVMIRNRRGHVSVKFPPRHAYTVGVKLTSEEEGLYHSVSAAIRQTAQAGGPSQRRTTGLRLVNLQEQLCSSPHAIARTLSKMAERDREPWSRLATEAAELSTAAKTRSALNIIAEAPDKVVVFTDHRATQEHILDRLDLEEVRAVAFHGGLSAREKERAVEAFKDDVRVLVSTESGAEGRNLQFCNVMINYDLPWNPMKLEQRIGRLHRLGQKREVFVFNLAARGTIEEKILDLLTRKIRMFELVIGELDLILGHLDEKATFEGQLRKFWLESTSDRELSEKLDAFGDELSRARDSFASVKEAELIVSQIFE